MAKCKNHPGVNAVYDNLCQPCLNAQKKQQKLSAATLPPLAVQWTPALIKETFGHLLKPIPDSGKGFYLVNGAKGAHIHDHPGGTHAKIGDEEHRFIKQDGTFDGAKWNSAVKDISDRKLGATGNQLLAGMAIMLAKLGGGLSEQRINTLIAALPIQTS